MINNRKIIVTGCAGFVGSNLVDKLIQNDVSVLGIDNLVTGQKRFLNSALKNKNFKFIKKDLKNISKLKKLFKNAEIVFHFAANADVRFGHIHPRKDLEQNTICTYNVLESMRVFLSTLIFFSISLEEILISLPTLPIKPKPHAPAILLFFIKK